MITQNPLGRVHGHSSPNLDTQPHQPDQEQGILSSSSPSPSPFPSSHHPYSLLDDHGHRATWRNASLYMAERDSSDDLTSPPDPSLTLTYTTFTVCVSHSF